MALAFTIVQQLYWKIKAILADSVRIHVQTPDAPRITFVRYYRYRCTLVAVLCSESVTGAVTDH